MRRLFSSMPPIQMWGLVQDGQHTKRLKKVLR